MVTPALNKTSNEVTPPDGAYQFHHEEMAASPPLMRASSTGSQLHSEGSVAFASFLMDLFDTNTNHWHIASSSLILDTFTIVSVGRQLRKTGN